MTYAGVCYLCPGTTHQHLHQNNTASAMIRSTLCHFIALQALVSCALINLVWNSVHMKAHQRCHYRFFKIHHGLMRISSHVIITTADAYTPTQAQAQTTTSGSASHLHDLPEVIYCRHLVFQRAPIPVIPSLSL